MQLSAALLAGVLVLVPDASLDTPGSKGPPPGFSEWGIVTGFGVPVFDRVESGRRVIGRVQRGTRLPVKDAKAPKRCYAYGKHGQWLASPDGFLCTSSGIAVGADERTLDPPAVPIDPDRPLSFTYVKVRRAGVDRFSIPLADPDVRVESQTKAFFLAKDRVLDIKGTRWLRTVYGEYVHADEVVPVDPSLLTGEAVDATTLPLGFVVTSEPSVPVLCKKKRRWRKCGRAARYAHISVKRLRRVRGVDYVEGRDGRLYPQENVRIARATPRPDSVPEDARWVHIDLDEQVFVAYEGDEPKYTSLVSTGVDTHATPTGTFTTQRKYLTKTMRGPDATHGRYRVEEIPWVMYYDGNYAVHGAYWHDTFGNVRSHGCINVSPADARWLYRFDRTRMPDGWHANLRADGGLFFHITERDEDQS